MAQDIEVEINNILPAHSHGAYTLILGEVLGKRKIPILIGTFEAQAIAMELEDIKPSRPLTHDLIVNMLQEFGIRVIRINIHNLKEGVFYSNLECEWNGNITVFDSRTSDAIAIAAKMHCPIFIDSNVMNEVGYVVDEKEENEPSRLSQEDLVPVSKSDTGYKNKTTEELEKMMEQAIIQEDYAKAAKIRDEINRRK